MQTIALSPVRLTAQSPGELVRQAIALAAPTQHELAQREARPGGRYPAQGLTLSEAGVRAGRDDRDRSISAAQWACKTPRVDTAIEWLSALLGGPYAVIVVAGDDGALRYDALPAVIVEVSRKKRADPLDSLC